jgi:hypothetical protein
MDELQRHLSKLPDQEDVPGLVPGPAIDDGQCLEDDLCCGQDDLWHILWPGFGKVQCKGAVQCRGGLQVLLVEGIFDVDKPAFSKFSTIFRSEYL